MRHHTRSTIKALCMISCLSFAVACSPPATTTNNSENNSGNNSNNTNNANNKNNQNNTNNANNKNNANNSNNCSTPVGECGNCDPDCQKSGQGPSNGNPFMVDPNSGNAQGVVVNPNGEITLEVDAVSADNKIIWVANTAQGTVSKVDTTTYMELARYYTGPDGAGNDPSRTSVNGFGDVYVGNRSAGTASKILRECVDANNDGAITTSTGAADVKNWGEDECVAWNKRLCNGCLIRAVAAQDIGPNEEINPVVWVGGFNNSTIWKLDGKTGEVLLTTTSPVRPYGFALDKKGNLWISGPNWGFNGEQRYFGRLDTKQCIDDASCNVQICDGETGDSCVKQRIPVSYQPYGITVDVAQRVWLGGESIVRYDPSKPMGQRTTEVRVQSGNTISFTHGIAADDKGWIYGATYAQGVVQINAEDLTQYRYIPNTQGSAKGIAVDKDSKIWSINRDAGTATVIQSGATINDSAVVSTVSGFVTPYTYSDMTGQQLSLASDVAGFFRQTYQECDKTKYLSTTWNEIVWDIDLPADTSATIRIRFGQSPDELSNAQWTTLATLPGMGSSPFDLETYLQSKGLAGVRYIELEVQMTAKRTPGVAPQPPVLKGLAVTKSCPVIIN